MAAECVTFGFTEIATDAETTGEAALPTPRTPRSAMEKKLKARAAGERNVGLGTGPGGQIARSFLGEKGTMVVESLQNGRSHHRGSRLSLLQSGPTVEYPKPTPPSGASSDVPPSLNEGSEPHGMFLALLLNDMEPPTEKDLQPVRTHRWTFHGAVDFAERSRSFCYFVRCLLDLQRNVQLEEEGDALDPKLANACKTFVTSQCRDSNMGGMYQLLTHFISNSAVFYEWDQFLRLAFDDQRASQESFLVPHLEQVWGRFCRFLAVLEGVFEILNKRFVWRHRLPKVGDLVIEHMKRRCFSSDAIIRNELFGQAVCRNETVKQVKYAFGIN